MEIRYRRLCIQTAKGKKKRYPEQIVTVIEAREQEMPPDRDRTDWKLITDPTVRMRWKRCNGTGRTNRMKALDEPCMWLIL